MPDETCSSCGRDLGRIVFCAVCRRELLCGSVSEPCTVSGCAERRIQEQYNNAEYLKFLEDSGEPGRLIQPLQTSKESN